MIIKLHGETSLSKLPKIIKEVVTNIQERAGIDASKFTVKDAEVGILFNVEGTKSMISVEHDGVAETFQVHVKLDSKGNVEAEVDNEKESFLDDYTRAVAKGEQPVVGVNPIESVFNDADLEEVGVENGGDIVAKYYDHKKEDLRVVRYYRNDVLVGEAGYKQEVEKEA